MTINANTRIAELLKANPDALEAIISVSASFSKLRNPILRKVMAGRTSIAMAAKVGGCSIDDLFAKLRPLGFQPDVSVAAVAEEPEASAKPLPGFLAKLPADQLVDLDVRPVIETGKDPLHVIISKVNSLETGQVLRIINSFEPTPLVHLLGKQGFVSFVDTIGPELVHAYFYRKGDTALFKGPEPSAASGDWEEVLDRYKDRLVSIDVRALEMPLPMHTILEALETLPDNKALFVHHKRIPVFLLPELEERKLSYRIKEIAEGDVNLLIYKN